MSAESERDELAAAWHTADEKRQRETETLNSNIEDLSQRAAAAEAAFAEARQNLLDKVEQLEKSLQAKTEPGPAIGGRARATDRGRERPAENF